MHFRSEPLFSWLWTITKAASRSFVRAKISFNKLIYNELQSVKIRNIDKLQAKPPLNLPKGRRMKAPPDLPKGRRRENEGPTQPPQGEEKET